MKFLSRKNRWQRLLGARGGRAESRRRQWGLVTAGTMVGLTVVSAVVSAARHSKEDR